MGIRSRGLAGALTLGMVVSGLGGGATALAAPAAPSVPALVANPATLVNPMTGTSGAVDTFPGPDMPFGMTQWSPDTSPDRPAGGGYEYNDTQLQGFSLTHISGPGCGAYGDIPILPLVGAMPANPESATANFSHTGEVAKAGYYKVTTTAAGASPNPVTTQLTTTMRGGLAQFTFPASTQSDLLLKTADSATQMDATAAQIIGNNEVTGSVTSGHFCGAPSQRDYTLHFDIQFEQPFASGATWSGGPNGGPGGVGLTFDTTTNQTVTARVGISFTSDANASLNLKSEIPGWDFAAVRSANEQAWNQVLGRIQIAGGTVDQQTQFYTALYHALLHPNVFSDVNGQYMGMDGTVHTAASGHDQYANYSGWDIYRDQVQLAAIVAPHQTSDSIRSMLNDYDQTGMLPKWAQANGESYVMVGDPADPIIADAYAFGARDFDTQKALQAMVTEATIPNNIRPGQSVLDQYGYLPNDMSYGCCNFYGAASTQLEYDTADYAIASFAQSLGSRSTYAAFAARAQNWQNIFNPASGYVQARLANGQWAPGFTPGTSTGMVEGTSAQYTPMVPFNLAGLIAARGGNQAWQSYLDSLFPSNLAQPSSTNANLSNEPSLEIPWEYDYVGAPWKTQQVVRQAQQQLYFNAPVGEFGNDDLGAMSSWYVWSELGMYPETPGTDTLVLGSPVFPHAVVHLANGKDITINAPKAATNAPYVQNLQLNGHSWPKTYLDGDKYSQGATLSFDLSTTPNKSWASTPDAAPPSDTTGEQPVLTSVTTPGQATNAGQVDLAPGGTATADLVAQNVTGHSVFVSWSGSAGTGVSFAPASGGFTLPASGKVSVPLTLRALSGAPDGFSAATVTLFANGRPLPSQSLVVLVAPPGSLPTFFNNAGVSDDAAQSRTNFDGNGYSYSAQALATAGLTAGSPVTVQGVTFDWQSQSGFPDNVVAAGQTIPVQAPAGSQQIGFLGSATGGPSEGPATLTYTDGTTSRYELGLSDWTLNANQSKPSYGNTVAAVTPYRNCACGTSQTVNTYVLSTALPVDPSKQLASVTLPTGTDQGQLHVFAIGTSTAAESGPVLQALSPQPASAGQVVTITGSGFGPSQGAGYVAFGDGGTNWGAPGNVAAFQVDSWSDTRVTFTVPTPSGPNGQWRVAPGTLATVAVTTATGATSDTGLLQITPTSNPADYYDNVGTSPDNNQACANYDGDGYSYSAQALAADGLAPGAHVVSGGLTYTWPQVSPCSADNILASGQTMLVPGSPGATTLGVLGSSSNGSSSGPVTISYTDGTSATAELSLDDWASAPSQGNTAIATMPYRNSVGGSSQQITMYVQQARVLVDPSKTVASVTLPDVSNTISGTTAMHIFAVALGS